LRNLPIPARSNTRGSAKSSAVHGTAGNSISALANHCDPKRFRTRAYAVNVEPGTGLVKGPYVAETLKVSVESDYVLVDL